MKFVSHFPSNNVVCARGIATEAQAANNLSIGSVEGESAGEDDDAADGFADHGVVGSTKRGRIAENSVWIGRRASREAIKALSGL